MAKKTATKPSSVPARRGSAAVESYKFKPVEFMTPPQQAAGPDVDVPPGWDDAEEAPSSLMPAADWQEPGEFVEGEYLGFVSDIGPNDSRQYRIKRPTGDNVCVWGTTILDQRMDAFAPARGETIMIQFIGDVATGRGLNPAHNFRIRRRK